MGLDLPATARGRGPTPVFSRNATKRPMLDVQVWIEPPFAAESAGAGGLVFAEDVLSIADLDERLDAVFAELRFKLRNDFERLIERRQAEERR